MYKNTVLITLLLLISISGIATAEPLPADADIQAAQANPAVTTSANNDTTVKCADITLERAYQGTCLTADGTEMSVSIAPKTGQTGYSLVRTQDIYAILNLAQPKTTYFLVQNSALRTVTGLNSSMNASLLDEDQTITLDTDGNMPSGPFTVAACCSNSLNVKFVHIDKNVSKGRISGGDSNTEGAMSSNTKSTGDDTGNRRYVRKKPGQSVFSDVSHAADRAVSVLTTLLNGGKPSGNNNVPDYRGPDDDGDGVPTATERKGRNPQTGKAIKIPAKTIDTEGDPVRIVLEPTPRPRSDSNTDHFNLIVNGESIATIKTTLHNNTAELTIIDATGSHLSEDELINTIISSTSLSKPDAKRALDAFQNAITDAIKKLHTDKGDVDMHIKTKSR